VRKKDKKLDAMTSAELDRAARITKADVARAEARWKRHAPPKFKNILAARRRRGR
jgi:hypothetical protein